MWLISIWVVGFTVQIIVEIIYGDDTIEELIAVNYVSIVSRRFRYSGFGSTAAESVQFCDVFRFGILPPPTDISPRRLGLTRGCGDVGLAGAGKWRWCPSAADQNSDQLKVPTNSSQCQAARPTQGGGRLKMTKLISVVPIPHIDGIRHQLRGFPLFASLQHRRHQEKRIRSVLASNSIRKADNYYQDL